MAEQNEARREQYTRTRTEFDHLAIEDKALFLIEATVSTLARGLEEAGQVLANELDRWFHPPAERAEEDAEPDPGTPPGAAPKTKQAAKSKAKPKKKKSTKGPTRPDESGVDEV